MMIQGDDDPWWLYGRNDFVCYHFTLSSCGMRGGLLDVSADRAVECNAVTEKCG